jgi:hypothetical protein
MFFGRLPTSRWASPFRSARSRCTDQQLQSYIADIEQRLTDVEFQLIVSREWEQDPAPPRPSRWVVQKYNRFTQRVQGSWTKP